MPLGISLLIRSFSRTIETKRYSIGFLFDQSSPGWITGTALSYSFGTINWRRVGYERSTNRNQIYWSFEQFIL